MLFSCLHFLKKGKKSCVLVFDLIRLLILKYLRNSPFREKKSAFHCISLLLGLNAVHVLGDWKKSIFSKISPELLYIRLNDVVDSCSPIFGVNNLSIWCHTIILYLIKHATNECLKNYWFQNAIDCCRQRKIWRPVLSKLPWTPLDSTGLLSTLQTKLLKFASFFIFKT